MYLFTYSVFMKSIYDFLHFYSNKSAVLECNIVVVFCFFAFLIQEFSLLMHNPGFISVDIYRPIWHTFLWYPDVTDLLSSKEKVGHFLPPMDDVKTVLFVSVWTT